MKVACFLITENDPASKLFFLLTWTSIFLDFWSSVFLLKLHSSFVFLLVSELRKYQVSDIKPILFRNLHFWMAFSLASWLRSLTFFPNFYNPYIISKIWMISSWPLEHGFLLIKSLKTIFQHTVWISGIQYNFVSTLCFHICYLWTYLSKVFI